MTSIPFAHSPEPPMGARRRKLFIGAALSLSLSLLGTPQMAFAETPSGLEEVGQKVSDSELADMRGKFVTSSSVAYFGVQMTTNWQGPDGITTVANLVFTLNFSSGQPSPQIQLGWTRQGDPSMDVASTPAAAPGIAVLPASGAVQSTVIAGSDNRATNMMTVAIAPQLNANLNAPAGLTPASPNQTQIFANGDTLRFIATSNGLGLAIGNGQNGATQMINGDVGQAMQAITLMGNKSSVFNTMSMIVGLAPGQNLDRVQADQALLSRLTTGF